MRVFQVPRAIQLAWRQIKESFTGFTGSRHVTALVTDGDIEPGIAELVEATAAMGLLPVRACAGHGPNVNGYPELPYVYFYAPDPKVAYQLYRICLAAQFKGHYWTLFAFFPGNREVIKEIEPRSLTVFKYRLEYRYFSRCNAKLDTQNSINFLIHLIHEANQPDWLVSKLDEMGFPTIA